MGSRAFCVAPLPPPPVYSTHRDESQARLSRGDSQDKGVRYSPEGLGDEWPFQPPLVFGADGTAETEEEAKKQLEMALALYRSRYRPGQHGG